MFVILTRLQAFSVFEWHPWVGDDKQWLSQYTWYTYGNISIKDSLPSCCFNSAHSQDSKQLWLRQSRNIKAAQETWNKRWRARQTSLVFFHTTCRHLCCCFKSPIISSSFINKATVLCSCLFWLIGLGLFFIMRVWRTAFCLVWTRLICAVNIIPLNWILIIQDGVVQSNKTNPILCDLLTIEKRVFMKFG